MPTGFGPWASLGEQAKSLELGAAEAQAGRQEVSHYSGHVGRDGTQARFTRSIPPTRSKPRSKDAMGRTSWFGMTAA